jgi:endonuclease/exonuclease/phosphatase family metal-dependent hydrolase
VAGDFNSLWGEQEINLFLAATGLCNADSRKQPSFPSWAPRRHLDFVLHSPEVRVTGFSAPDVRFSDHLPLVCDFEIERTAGAATQSG